MVTRTNRGAEGISGRVKFLPLAWAGMPKTSFRKNSDSSTDGLLKVQVTARNVRTGFWDQASSWYMGDNPYQIAYRFTWLDIDGMEVNTAASTWIPMTVVPGDTVRLHAISPNPRCKDFILSIRENDAARRF
ncbi:hypothetical protein BMR07_06205 [Methylococcaceae bacterium CS1]|nr:hypothetical protein BMR09_10460 [Methylococcaceae bacterium CS3]TXL06760.1 hypothetical protein BMR07_06205 [Methylococcaceae bacterium CS1]TXL09701.1 hypothetical protein BMR08_12685 [Methylococcaceae bacterium CS2]